MTNKRTAADFGGAAQAVSGMARAADAIIQWTLPALVALMPVFFLPWTVEVLEFNKQLLLFVAAAVAGLAWIGKMLAERRLEYRKSPVNYFVILYVAVYGVSAGMSISRHTSLLGGIGQESSGFFSVLAMAILYFVAVNNIRTASSLRRIFSAFVVGGVLTAVFGLLQGFGIYAVPLGFARDISFNTVGTVASMGMYLALVASVIGGALLMGRNGSGAGDKRARITDAALALLAALSLLLIAAIDFWPVNAALFVASASLLAFVFVHARSMRGIGGALLPIASLVVSLLLLIADLPAGFGYPAEVMPSTRASLDIATQTLRERPLLGSGPGTFILDYTKYRSPDVNRSQFWNTRFDHGSSYVLTQLASMGYLGTAAWLALVACLLFVSVRSLLRANEKAWHMTAGVFSAWLLLEAGKFFYGSNLTLELMTWMMMGLLVIVLDQEWRSVKFESSPRTAMALSFLFILFSVLAASGLFVEGQRYAAEVHYARAIANDRAGGKVDATLSSLASAANLDRSNDAYLRSAALGMLAKADELFYAPLDLKKDEGESDADLAARQGAATEDRVREALGLTANAVNTAKRATEIDGANVDNWSVLASVYQRLLGVTEGADGWAITTHEKAIELEPANPALHTELGKVYLWQADRQRALAEQQGTKKEDADAARASSEELLQKAVDTFTKATTLKADYAPAYYHQGLAYERQGKSEDAISRLEAVVTISPQDVGVGFQLALLYFQNERKADAIALMESVVRLSPDDVNARWYLAAMYEDAGRLPEAIEQVTKAKELSPDDEAIAQKLSDLSSEAGQEGAAPDEALPEPVE